MTDSLLAVRPDHGHGVGGGHLGRCLALAQAWIDRGGSVFLVADDPPDAWKARWAREGVTVVPTACWPRADAYVLDGYRLGPEAQRVVPDDGPLLVMDDFGQVELGRADIVLDQNLGAHRQPGWPVDAEPLLGPRYALIRREIRRYGPVERDLARHPTSIVVSAGSSPPGSWLKMLERAVSLADVRLSTTRLAGVDDVAGVLAGSDVGILAAGSTVWEAMLLGLPFVAVAFADNQRIIARQLGAAGAAIDGGDHAAVTAEELAGRLRNLVEDTGLRNRLAETGPRLVDGSGAERVVSALLNHDPRGRGRRAPP